jgi:hypothetical protein
LKWQNLNCFLSILATYCRQGSQLGA